MSLTLVPLQWFYQMDDTSLEVVNAREMYPGQPFTSDGDDGSIPFALLSGENPLFKGHSSDNVIVITNYRFYHSENPCINIPLGLIDYVECREILYIWIHCKDARTYRCVFENADETKKWLERIQMNIKLPEKIDHSFAFRFLSWTREDQKDVIMSQSLNQLEELLEPKDQPPENFLKEAQRMGFNFKHVWKISRINENYKFCPSYPRYIIFPAIMDDPAIQDTANFRYSRRIPAVVWRYPRNGCVIARCSQPKLGLLYWRNSNDENLIAAILSACSEDKGDDSKEEIREPVLKNEDDADMSIYCSEDSAKKSQKRLLIMDARSFFHAAGNRTKGGGYECTSYYLNCDIHYMGLANIHTIRSSFNALRTLASADDQIWLSTLESTKWLHHISGLLRSALVAVDAIDIDEKPVLVHCSDGWDRTPQIVALAEIMLDPYYRTKKGFQVLVEREWLEFGHKFADRCGNPGGTDDRNERCPVFLQWLDCIYQLLNQFPCHFEFNEQYLARLVLHSYSSLFGTFLCNTEEDRKTHSVPLRTYSVWPVLNDKSQFHNYLYNKSTEVLRPSYQIRCLKFWSELYVPNSSIGLVKQTLPPPVEEVPLVESIPEKTNLVKTKSCDDIHSTEHLEMLHRHNSDPNLVENSFAETVTCSQLQNCNEGTNNLLTVETPLCDDKANSTISERTENQISEAIVNSNLILREPTIDGSTDTLVSESGAVVQEQNEIKSSSEELCDTRLVSKPSSSISTDTSDLPILLEDLLLSMTQNAGYIDSAISNIPDWCQNVMDTHVFKRNGHSNSFSCSYTTPNHSRTPSSGFPATPCDDSNDLPNLKKESSCQVMEFDGLDIMSNCVQERIRKLLLHYKDKVGNLNSQLAAVRLEFLQHICRHYQGKDRCRLEEDAPSLADSASSGDHQVESEEGSESSWDLICSLDHGTTGLGM
ncbi:myotubularin-related protein 3 [Caerostris darwini]|uniref:Myotubularin-related protein 3 n=1 Tax=Caerostris darwini TaxID=1538125 RepID=A0AAV4QCR4_9ARAC|nr:myotubularin-related protein 3 [Caerostris darwini]